MARTNTDSIIYQDCSHREDPPIKLLSNSEMASVPNCILHATYFAFYSFVKYASFPFFNYLRYAILRVFGCKTRSTYIADGVTILFPWRVNIAERCSLNQGVIIDGTAGVTLERGVRIAPYVCINTADHCFSDPDVLIADQGFSIAPVTIEEDVWIGAGVQINKGVRIGRGSVIGSGAVVTRDIPPYSIAVGIPARVVGSRQQSKL